MLLLPLLQMIRHHHIFLQATTNKWNGSATTLLKTESPPLSAVLVVKTFSPPAECLSMPCKNPNQPITTSREHFIEKDGETGKSKSTSINELLCYKNAKSRFHDFSRGIGLFGDPVFRVDETQAYTSRRWCGWRCGLVRQRQRRR